MASFGEELKRERELRDISLKEISEATKISIRFLEALEQNNFDILPGGIFNRGFIRAYARFIGIDGEEMVNAYLHEVALKEARQAQRGAAAAGQRAAAQRPPMPTESRAEVRPERRSAQRPPSPGTFAGFEGRSSLLLWAMAVIAFIVGAVVIVMSLMQSRAPAPPTEPASSSTTRPSTAGRAQPPPEPLVAGLGEKEPSGSFMATGTQAAPIMPVEESTEPAPRQPEETVAPPDRDAGTTSQEQGPAETGTDPAEPEIPRHRVRVLATETTGVLIQCAGQTVLDQELWPGQTRTFTCEEPVVLGADNAGAVQYSLDGAPSALLGSLGQKIEGLIVAPPPAPATTSEPGGPRAGN